MLSERGKLSHVPDIFRAANKTHSRIQNELKLRILRALRITVLNIHACPKIPSLSQKIPIYNYLSSKNTYIYALLPTIYSSLAHNAVDISHDRCDISNLSILNLSR